MRQSLTTRLGKLLFELRRRSVMTQDELASLLQVNVSTIQELEEGRSEAPTNLQFFIRLQEVEGFATTNVATWFIDLTEPSIPPATLEVEFLPIGSGTDAFLLHADPNGDYFLLQLRFDLDRKVADAIIAEAAQIVREQAYNPDFYYKTWPNSSGAPSENPLYTYTEFFLSIGGGMWGIYWVLSLFGVVTGS